MVPDLSIQAIAFVLVVTRVAAFVTVLPVFRRELLPNTIKVGLVFSLTLLWWDSAAVNDLQDLAANGNAELIVSVVKEACLGAGMGFLMGLFMFPAQVAGSWLSQELGLSMSSMTDPVSQQGSTVVSQIITAITTLLFLSMNLHHSMFAALGATFERIPFGSGLAKERFATYAVDAVAIGHEQGMAIAAPVGVLLFLGSVVMFLLNKASPQLNLFSIGLPLRLVGGFTALFILLPETCILISQSLRIMISQFQAVL